MITEITRNLTGVYSYANTTIIFDANPFLVANNELTLYFTNNDSRHSATVTSVSGNNAVVNFSNPQYANTAVVAKTPCFSTGITGPQAEFSLHNSITPNALIQVTAEGSGGGSLNIEVSADRKGWVNAASISLTQGSNTEFFNVTTPWPYGRVNISSVDANTTLSVTKAN